MPVDEPNAKLTTPDGTELAPYWMGVRVDKNELPSGNASLPGGKPKRGRGIPNHPLLQNLSVFLPQDTLQRIMQEQELLEFDEATDKIVDSEKNIQLILQIAQLLKDCKYGVWAAEDDQLKNDSRTVDNVVWGDRPLLCHIFSDEQVEQILGKRCGSQDKLPIENIQTVVKLQSGVSETNSLYHDPAFINMMRSDKIRGMSVVLYEYALLGKNEDGSPQEMSGNNKHGNNI